MSELNTLREKIADIDYNIFKLISERCVLAKEVGNYKIENNIPIRNYQVEDQVIKRSRKLASTFSISRETAENIIKLIIIEAISVQKKLYSENNQSQKIIGKRCLIIGGGGKMGTWLVDFLHSSGHQVKIVDPAITSRTNIFSKIPVSIDEYDIIGIATPIDTIPSILKEIIMKNPKGLIFDIGSIKSSFIDIIAQGVCDS